MGIRLIISLFIVSGIIADRLLVSARTKTDTPYFLCRICTVTRQALCVAKEFAESLGGRDDNT